ncbi:MAG: RidA family protein [Candidatus Eremiobacteraeota bacterium]|nr:RidA family protein [Candidatus Eremiobacteraeota bacterium]NNM92276.1 RidA family protein [Candidatus Eremiobacteraeota bacterium]
MSKRIEPAGWAPPSGYANGMLASGRFLAIAGQVGWDARQQLVSEDFLAQAEQAMRNISEVLRTAGGAPEHLVRMTWYVLDAAEYRANAKALGAAYRELFGSHYPAMTLIVVAGLLEAGARVEIEATAVLPVL